MPREARPYVAVGKLPSDLKQPRNWRTRPDSFEEHWPENRGQAAGDAGARGQDAVRAAAAAIPRPLAEPAIALVDEIDLHLHPRWQRDITAHLDRLFPNVQFIVTAHSPLVVQGAGMTNVAVLQRVDDHVEILNDPEEVRGWRVDQILTSDLFGLRSAPLCANVT